MISLFTALTQDKLAQIQINQMRKHNLLTPIAIVILGVLVSGESIGKNKHVLVKLKGNVLYAAKRDKKVNSENSDAPVVAVKKKKKPEKLTPIVVVDAQAAPEVNNTPTIQNETISNATPIQSNTPSYNFDYEQRQIAIHTSIFQLYPGTYLDSMSIVNQLLNDSIRSEILTAGTVDRIEYLKNCLESSIKDSITLAKLSTLSSPDQQVAYVPTGVLIAHCKDASSTLFMDSVVMDVFSGSNLVASATSDKDGIILAKGVPEGNYYVVFSRKSYEPYSLMNVNVNTAGQSYVDIPLIKANGYLAQSMGKNAWVFLTTGIVATLLVMVILAYYLAKYTSRRRFAAGHGTVTTA